MFTQPKLDIVGSTRRSGAHTLVEFITAIGVFSLVGAALMSAHIFGLRQGQLTESKLGASDMSRRVFGKITGEIRAAKTLHIGNGDLESFTCITNDRLQIGNALQLNLTTDTNSFVRYYFETNNSRLCRISSRESRYDVIADHLTNSMYFSAEDYKGSIVTDPAYKYVVKVTMEFCQYQYPLTKVGPGCFYDYYRLQFRVTAHCPSVQ